MIVDNSRKDYIHRAACRAQDDPPPKKGHQNAYPCRFLLKSRFCRPAACSSSFAARRAQDDHKKEQKENKNTKKVA